MTFSEALEALKGGSGITGRVGRERLLGGVTGAWRGIYTLNGMGVRCRGYRPRWICSRMIGLRRSPFDRKLAVDAFGCARSYSFNS